MHKKTHIVYIVIGIIFGTYLSAMVGYARGYDRAKDVYYVQKSELADTIREYLRKYHSGGTNIDLYKKACFYLKDRYKMGDTKAPYNDPNAQVLCFDFFGD